MPKKPQKKPRTLEDHSTGRGGELHQLAGALSAQGARMLRKEPAAVAWVHDAFAHCKVIGATCEAKELLDAAGVVPDEGVLTGAGANAFLSSASNGRIWSKEAKVRTVY